MKFLKLPFLLLLLPVVFFSCKKDSDTVQQALPGIEGDWVGKYGFGNEVPAIYYRFNIQPGGAIEELSASGNSKGNGTWSLNGTTFTAHYQMKAPLNAIYTVAATYNESTGKLSGTWGYDDNASNGGLWEQTKQ